MLTNAIPIETNNKVKTRKFALQLGLHLTFSGILDTSKEAFLKMLTTAILTETDNEDKTRELSYGKSVLLYEVVNVLN